MIVYLFISNTSIHIAYKYNKHKNIIAFFVPKIHKKKTILIKLYLINTNYFNLLYFILEK